MNDSQARVTAIVSSVGSLSTMGMSDLKKQIKAAA
jgi:hypothetical protein